MIKKYFLKEEKEIQLLLLILNFYNSGELILKSFKTFMIII